MDTEVLIVGAGPTGLVLATWLASRGIRIRIIDKTAEPGRTSRALAVQSRTLEFYRQLGFADDVVGAGLSRSSFYRKQQGPQKFKPGDRVRTKNIHPATHTRLPRYARDKVGVVEMCHGCHMFPDSVATDRGDNPQWLYTVVFESRELWGPDADPTLKISIDAFEPYLDPA